MTDGLKNEHREAIIAAIAANDRVERAVLFGSRATGTNTVSSDVDIALFGDRLTLTDHAHLAVALDELPMAQKIDLVLYDSIQDETLQKNIRCQSIEWYARPIQGDANRRTSRDACTWPLMSLRQAGVSLIDCEHRTPPATDDGYPYVGIPQIKNGRVDLDSARPIAEEHYREWTRKANPQPFDIVLSRRCNPGETGFVSPGLGAFAVGQNLVLLRSDGEKISKPFLRWLSRGPDWWAQIAKYINAGAVFDSLKCADIPKFRLPIPSLSEQNAIAHILGTLDDKIELNRRMNATLEEMARALFKSWFIDFDPIRAKGYGRDLGLAQKLLALFPESFDNKGRPQGWSAKPLDQVAEFLNGLAMQKFPPFEVSDSLPVIKISELRSGITPRTGRASRNIPSDYVVRDGDFLFSWSGSLIAKFWTGSEGALNQHLFKVTSSRYPMWFCSQWIYHHLEEFQAIAASKATTMGHIQRGHLKRAMATCPPDGVLAELGHIMELLVDRVIKNELESRTLVEIRDLLLSKLITGELRVQSDVNRMDDAT